MSFFYLFFAIILVRSTIVSIAQVIDYYQSYEIIFPSPGCLVNSAIAVVCLFSIIITNMLTKRAINKEDSTNTVSWFLSKAGICLWGLYIAVLGIVGTVMIVLLYKGYFMYPEESFYIDLITLTIGYVLTLILVYLTAKIAWLKKSNFGVFSKRATSTLALLTLITLAANAPIAKDYFQNKDVLENSRLDNVRVINTLNGQLHRYLDKFGHFPTKLSQIQSWLTANLTEEDNKLINNAGYRRLSETSYEIKRLGIPSFFAPGTQTIFSVSSNDPEKLIVTSHKSASGFLGGGLYYGVFPIMFSIHDNFELNLLLRIFLDIELSYYEINFYSKESPYLPEKKVYYWDKW